MSGPGWQTLGILAAIALACAGATSARGQDSEGDPDDSGEQSPATIVTSVVDLEATFDGGWFDPPYSTLGWSFVTSVRLLTFGEHRRVPGRLDATLRVSWKWCPYLSWLGGVRLVVLSEDVEPFAVLRLGPCVDMNAPSRRCFHANLGGGLIFPARTPVAGVFEAALFLDDFDLRFPMIPLELRLGVIVRISAPRTRRAPPAAAARHGEPGDRS